MPSGIVRVESYLARLRAMGIECRVYNYFSPALRRNSWRWDGPRRHRSALLRSIARGWFSCLDTAHIWLARLRLLRDARSSDAIVLQWISPPQWLSRWLYRGQARLVYDFDDAVYLINEARVNEVLRLSWRAIAGSHALLAHARSHASSAVLIPSPIDVEQFPVVDSSRTVPPAGKTGETTGRHPFRVGWIGSAGTLPYLEELAEPLARLARSGVPVRFLVAGTEGRSDLVPRPAGVEVIEISRYAGVDMPHLAAQMDVGVMPMPDGAWERGKCAMKALVYMAAGLPVVCSPVGENLYVVRTEESGLHASTADEWFSSLTRLAADEELRSRMGRAGRERVEAEYATSVCFELLRTHILTPLARELAGSETSSGRR